MRIVLGALPLVLGMVLTATCAAAQTATAEALTPDSTQVLAVTRRWLAILDSGRYAESLDSAAPMLRQLAGSTEAWRQLAVRARAGFPVSPSRSLVELDPAPDLAGAPAGQYVQITFRVGVGTATVYEIVVLQATPNGWRVAMYGTRPG
jgi:Protein of unknown function (DUF4019)